jgi:hypothetical protein
MERLGVVFRFDVPSQLRVGHCYNLVTIDSTALAGGRVQYQSQKIVALGCPHT